MNLPFITNTVADTNTWLREIAGEIERPGDYQAAYHTLRAVLHTVRDTLVPEETMNLSAELTPLLRGILFEGYRLAGKPEPKRSLDIFLQAVDEHLLRYNEIDIDPEAACRAVFAQLEKHLAAGQSNHVRHMLNHEVQDLWPAATVK